MIWSITGAGGADGADVGEAVALAPEMQARRMATDVNCTNSFMFMTDGRFSFFRESEEEKNNKRSEWGM